MKYCTATYGKYGVIWVFFQKYCPKYTAIWNLAVFRRWSILHVYTPSFIYIVCNVPIVLLFRFTISKFVLLLRKHFVYVKTGISQVKLPDNDPAGQEFLHLLRSLEVQYCSHNSLTLVPIMSHLNSIQTIDVYSFKIRLMSTSHQESSRCVYY